MKIKFCGAARSVTGSAHLITLDNGFKILLDCGLYQGRRKDMVDFNQNWLFKPSSIDMMVLSHAHIDHTGRLPKLVKDGFKGNIYSTHATRSLCAIMLLDSAKIQESDANYYNKKLKKKKKRNKKLKKKFRTPLYTTKDVLPTMQNFVGMPYGRWHKVNDQVEILFRDAGHILGSASVTLKITENGKTKLIGFTGDIGRPNRPILRDPQQMPEVDYLITESTYGDKEHDAKPKEAKRFLDIIKETCIKNKGKLIIPAFSVGRTQEIVHMMDQLENAGELPKIPIYVDSPLAVSATQIFGSHPECYDNDLNEYMLVDNNPFGFNELTYIRKVELSKQLNFKPEPCVIISSSGMMNAGRIKHHLFNNLEDSKNTLLIVGYCSPDTLGGIIKAGAEKVKLFGEWKNILAKVETMHSFSAHADRKEMIEFMSNQTKKVKKLFLVHGEIERQEIFKKSLLKSGFKSVEIPDLNDEFELK